MITEHQIEELSDEIIRQLICQWKVPLSQYGHYVVPGQQSSLVYNLIRVWLTENKEDATECQN